MIDFHLVIEEIGGRLGAKLDAKPPEGTTPTIQESQLVQVILLYMETLMESSIVMITEKEDE